MLPPGLFCERFQCIASCSRYAESPHLYLPDHADHYFATGGVTGRSIRKFSGDSLGIRNCSPFFEVTEFCVVYRARVEEHLEAKLHPSRARAAVQASDRTPYCNLLFFRSEARLAFGPTKSSVAGQCHAGDMAVTGPTGVSSSCRS